jgi:CHASE3 domain sensor protein
MAKENDIKKELLKQMDKDSDKIPEANMKSLKEIIAKDLARIKRLKWVTICSWLLVGICFIVAAFLEQALVSHALIDTERDWLNSLIIILRALLVIAIFLTVSLYIRSRTLTIHKIQIRLSNIEMLLRQMSQDK